MVLTIPGEQSHHGWAVPLWNREFWLCGSTARLGGLCGLMVAATEGAREQPA